MNPRVNSKCLKCDKTVHNVAQWFNCSCTPHDRFRLGIVVIIQQFPVSNISAFESGNCWIMTKIHSVLGYWHQRADERHRSPPQGNQELLAVRDKVGRPPGELGYVTFGTCQFRYMTTSVPYIDQFQYTWFLQYSFGTSLCQFRYMNSNVHEC